jgi:hypothetical protein
VLLVAVVSGVGWLDVPFMIRLLPYVMAGLLSGLVLRGFHAWATRRNTWPH